MSILFKMSSMTIFFVIVLLLLNCILSFFFVQGAQNISAKNTSETLCLLTWQTGCAGSYTQKLFHYLSPSKPVSFFAFKRARSKNHCSVWNAPFFRLSGPKNQHHRHSSFSTSRIQTKVGEVFCAH